MGVAEWRDRRWGQKEKNLPLSHQLPFGALCHHQSPGQLGQETTAHCTQEGRDTEVSPSLPQRFLPRPGLGNRGSNFKFGLLSTNASCVGRGGRGATPDSCLRGARSVY